MKSLFYKIFQIPIYIHLLAVIVLFFLVAFGTLKYIDWYTNHNKAVNVPDVRKLQIEEAAPFLEQNMLHYIIIDSIYSKEFMPGAIVELSPEANSKVKKNRIIYITVNAKTDKTVPMPELTDISVRQSYSDLKALGFNNIILKYVQGEFKDLTVGVEYENNLVKSGARVPLSATLTLVIQDGNVSVLDNLEVDEEQTAPVKSDESYFE